MAALLSSELPSVHLCTGGKQFFCSMSPSLRVGAKKKLYGLQNLRDNNHLCCLTVNSHHTLTKQSLRSGKDRRVHFKCKCSQKNKKEQKKKKNSLRNSSINTLIKETMTNSDDEHGRDKTFKTLNLFKSNPPESHVTATEAVWSQFLIFVIKTLSSLFEVKFK